MNIRVTFTWAAIILFCPVSAYANSGVDYLKQIKPLLKEHCFSCHGALKQRGGLRADTVDLMRKGGDAGSAIIPGKAEKSLIFQRLISKNANRRMPKKAKPLSKKHIDLIRAWIDQGAKGPAVEVAETDPREHWAFKMPVRAPLPQVKSNDWMTNPIDRFIGAELHKKGLKPASVADKETLLRRVYIDLVGLPPTREQLHAFRADKTPKAFEKVIDKLLASPQHGERWARHWMDVWRYSDWYGRRQVNDVRNSHPLIWRWRDWIIQSLNDDMGYDRMVRAMLAADEIAGDDDDMLPATGFIARNWYSLNYEVWKKDLVEHTGKAFLGLTFNCCHCHDHKYDPISHEDYFRFRAFFEPLQLRLDRVPGEADPGKFKKYVYGSSRKPITTGMVRVCDENLDAKTYMYSQGDARLKIKGKPPVAPGIPKFFGVLPEIEQIELPPAAWYPGLKKFIQKEESAKKETAVAKLRSALTKAKGESNKTLARLRLDAAEAQLKAVHARLKADQATYLQVTADASELAQLAAKAERFAATCATKANVLAAENAVAAAKGRVTAATGKNKTKALAALKKTQQTLAGAKKALATAQANLKKTGGNYSPFGPQYSKHSSGRRNALAEWIGSFDNPLTARVAVNHIWLRHFGRPLVQTVYNFGRSGAKPTHPELLDWLAVEFMESGWSMKHLHKLIVTSRTYQLETWKGSSPNQKIDPENRFYWQHQRRRMEAEAIRDGILHLAGSLEKKIGGPVLDVKQSNNIRRRSFYFSVYPEAGGSVKFLTMFDAPDPCECYRRSKSIVPQQALAMANSRLILDQSRLLARRLWSKGCAKLKQPAKAESNFICAAFEQILTRSPTEREKSMCVQFLQKQTEVFRRTNANRLTTKTTGGKIGPAPDIKMRARESVVRVLFNHDDFVSLR